LEVGSGIRSPAPQPDTLPAIQTGEEVYRLQYFPDQSGPAESLQIPDRVGVVIRATYTNRLKDTVLVHWYRRDRPDFTLFRRIGDTWQAAYDPIPPIGEDYLALAPGQSHTFIVVADHYLAERMAVGFTIGTRKAKPEEIPGEYRLFFTVLKRSPDPHRLGERVPPHARISNAFRIEGPPK
jgi:hypothetical protein